MMEGIGKKPAHLRKKKYKKESYVSLLWKCFDSILDFFFFFPPSGWNALFNGHMTHTCIMNPHGETSAFPSRCKPSGLLWTMTIRPSNIIQS